MTAANTLVVAPHPDDETLGCGGTLLRTRAEGGRIHWLIVTGMELSLGFSAETIAAREREIEKAAAEYAFDSVHQLKLPTTQLDVLPLAQVIAKIKDVFESVQPSTVYAPFRGDAHSDHRVVFDAVAACTKWFRFPCLRRVLAYETLSETEFNIDPDRGVFTPNVFVHIGDYVEKKIEILKLFRSEVHPFPFPRSEVAVRSLAAVRGAASGNSAAEAFMLLREIR